MLISLSEKEFRRRFETPILRGRDADATDEAHKKGAERLQVLHAGGILRGSFTCALVFTYLMQELAAAVERCIIRRTQALLSKYLPVKVTGTFFWTLLKSVCNLFLLRVKIEQVVVCSLTPLQRSVYESFVSSDTVRRSLKGTN